MVHPEKFDGAECFLVKIQGLRSSGDD